MGHNPDRDMRISAKVDYAVRAGIELATAERGSALKGDLIAERQHIPVKFLENILGEMKHHGLIASRRGAEGGYWLAKDPADVSIADVIRAVEGPLASVRGEAPENLDYEGNAAPLRKVWIAVRANLRAVLEETTLADLVGDELPAAVLGLTEPAEAWEPR
jgi:Rrf2 family protein